MATIGARTPLTTTTDVGPRADTGPARRWVDRCRAHPTTVGVGAVVVGFLVLCAIRILSLKPWVTLDE
jgi:hypothetical protein